MTLNEYIKCLQDFAAANKGAGGLPVCIGDEVADQYWNEVRDSSGIEIKRTEYAAPDSTRWSFQKGVIVTLSP